MEHLYDLVEACLKSSEATAFPNLLNYLQTEKTEQKGTLFGCSSHLEYILKRFINGCLSTDPEIKDHARRGL